MSDQTNPEPRPGAELEIDLSAFLPEGVTVGSEADEEVDHPLDVPAEAGVPTDAVAEAGAEAPTESDEIPADPIESVPVEAPTPDAPTPDAPTPVDDSIDLELLAAVEADLDAVEASLAALDDGTYGTCAVCRSEISAELLASDPVRRTCSDHA